MMPVSAASKCHHVSQVLISLTATLPTVGAPSSQCFLHLSRETSPGAAIAL